MNYHIQASSHSKQDAQIHIKASNIDFGTTPETVETLPNPAELLLGSFAACMLKNVERFSKMMQFTYEKTTLDVQGTWLKTPPRMDVITYELMIHTSDKKLNTALLKKNIEKFGTIYNTLQIACTISGTIKTIDHV
jgi:uncharacterized OsmC-like protein